MIEHCISLFKKEQVDKTYRIYITDCLQAIAENTTHHMGMGGMVECGKSMSMRWIDIAEPKSTEKRTAKQIISKLKNGINGLLKRGDTK